MQTAAAEPVKLAYVYIYRLGVTGRFKVGKALDVESRTRRSLRNVDPEYAEFDRIELDAAYVYDCETYLKNRLASHRVQGTTEFFELGSGEAMISLIAECRSFFAEYIRLHRAVENIEKQDDGTWLRAGPEALAIFEQLATLTQRRDECQWRIELLQDKLKVLINTAAGIAGLVSWRTNEPSTCFDQEAFKADHLELFEKYQKPRATVRPFKPIFVGERRDMPE